MGERQTHQITDPFTDDVLAARLVAKTFVAGGKQGILLARSSDVLSREILAARAAARGDN